MSSGKWWTAVMVSSLVFASAGARLWAAGAPADTPAAGAAITSPSVLLEKGIYAEETTGDLDAAIKIYQDIVAQDKANRPLAAQAQYRLAMCYLKKGDKTRATAELQTVLATYSQEAAVAAKAQTELAKLSPPVAGPPHVVLTTPATLTNNVDPSLGKITVTFDRPMMDKNWSFTNGDQAFSDKTGTLPPEPAGEVSYDALRTTCTMPVKLQPGKVYWVGINGPQHQNFKGADGTPAKQHLILFATKSADGKPTPLPADLVEQAKTTNATAAPVGLDPQQARALLGNMQALIQGVYKAMEQNDIATARILLKQEIAQVRDFQQMVRGTPAEQAVKTGLPMLENIEAALAKNDVAQAMKLMETLGAMGPALGQSVMDALNSGATPPSPTGGQTRVLDVAKIRVLGKAIGGPLDALRSAVDQKDAATAATLFDVFTKQWNGFVEATRGSAAENTITAIQPIVDGVGSAIKNNDFAQAAKLLSAFDHAGAGHGLEDAIKASGPKTISSKAELINCVEKFFSGNFRDVTARKTLEWGEPETKPDGNLAIRYKYLATIWNIDQMTIEQRFTFTPQGEYVSVETLEKAPATQPEGIR